MIIVLSEATNVYKKPTVKAKALAVLNNEDVVFSGRNFIVNNDRWTKVELCHCIGYVKNIQQKQIPLAVLNIKGRKIYSNPKLNSQMAFILKGSERFFILDTLQSEGSMWYKIVTCNTRLEGYFYVSDSSLKPSVLDYKIVNNSFREYLSYISSKAFRTNARATHLLGFLPSLFILSVALLLKNHLNSLSVYFLMTFAFLFMLIMPLFFSWLIVKYLK